MLESGQKIWFCYHDGIHEGIIDKINKNTINVLEENNARPEGYRLWRITDFFLADSPESAKIKWKNYLERLKQYKKELYSQRFGRFKFERGMSVLVYSLEGPPYRAMITKLNKVTLDVVSEDKRFMKVDKAICEPINEIIYFN